MKTLGYQFGLKVDLRGEDGGVEREFVGIVESNGGVPALSLTI
jgi:hypothetical protein